MHFDKVEQALAAMRAGQMVILADDESRENEGDLCLSAQMVTAEAINFMARHARGLICLTLTPERVAELALPMMVADNTSVYGTAFTVSIEARQGVSTGISAADRAATIACAVNPACGPADLTRPGHVFPLRARPGGALVRMGQTEGSVDLARLAGLHPSAVICEVMNEDGTMARRDDLQAFAALHDLCVLSVADVVAYRLGHERLVRHQTQRTVTHPRYGNLELHVYQTLYDMRQHVVLVKGEPAKQAAAAVWVQPSHGFHSVLADVLGDDRARVRQALQHICRVGHGVVVCLDCTGEATGLEDWLEQLNTPDPRVTNKSPAEVRNWGVAGQILRDLGLQNVTMLGDAPKDAFAGQGVRIVAQADLAFDGETTGELS